MILLLQPDNLISGEGRIKEQFHEKLTMLKYQILKIYFEEPNTISMFTEKFSTQHKWEEVCS